MGVGNLILDMMKFIKCILPGFNMFHVGYNALAKVSFGRNIDTVIQR